MSSCNVVVHYSFVQVGSDTSHTPLAMHKVNMLSE